MPNDLADFGELKDQVSKLQRAADRAAGALTEAMKRLKAEFGCVTIEEAQALLETLQKQEAKGKAAFDKALQAFERKWKDVLKSTDAE